MITFFIIGGTDCSSGFISYEDIKKQAKYVTLVVDDDEQVENRFYKDIGFNCNGTITNVIVGVKNNLVQTMNPPEIRIWRSTGNEYTQSGPSIQLYYDNAAQDVSTEYLRWYNLSEPVPIEAGDVLGIYQPAADVADSVIYYQEYSGPINFNGNNMPTDSNYYPLVSVKFGKDTINCPFFNLYKILLE